MSLGKAIRRALPTKANRFRAEALKGASALVSEGVAQSIETVPGCLSREQGQMLCWLGRSAPAGAVVEIGSFLGKSTLWLAHGMKAGGRRGLYAIDPHNGHERPEVETGIRDTFQAFLSNVEKGGFGGFVTPIRKLSSEAAQGWKEPIAVLWVDGSHDYEDVKSDLELFSPHVVAGGYIAMHDVSGRHFPGTRKAMLEFFRGNAAFECASGFHNMEVFRKR